MPTAVSAPRPVAADHTAAAGKGVAPALLALAWVLALARFVRLGEWSLWIDEAHTLHDALVLGERVPRFPLSYLMTAAVVQISGARDEWTLRLAPAVLGWLAVPLSYWCFRPAGRLRAAGCALLVAVSPWQLFWSQSVRGYTLAQDLSLIGGGLWLRGIASGGALRVAGGLLLGALAALAHPSAGLLLLPWVLAPWLAPLIGVPLPARPPRAVLLAALAAVAALTSVWGAGVWSTYAGAKPGATALHFARTAGYYATPLVSLGALWGAILAWRRRETIGALAGLTCALVVALVLLASQRAVVSAQYVFALLPWIAFLATGPLEVLRSPARRAAWLALLALPMAVETALYLTVRHGDRPRWREAYAHVWSERGPGDIVVAMSAPVGEYYLAPGRDSLRSQRSVETLTREAPRRCEAWAREGRRVWLVLRPENVEGWDEGSRQDFREWLASRCRLTRRFEVPLTPRDLDVEVWVRE